MRDSMFNRSGLRQSDAMSNRSSRKLASGVDKFESRVLFSTYLVNTVSDALNPGAGMLTLRQAIAEANAESGSNTIAFDPNVFTPGNPHKILLTQGEIRFSDTEGTTTVNGPGSAVLAVDAQNHSRVFAIDKNVSVSIHGLAIIDGKVSDSNGAVAVGGGILNSGSLVLANDLVSNNSTYTEDLNSAAIASGGGIYSIGPLTISNSIVTGNSSLGNNNQDPGAEGGAVYASGAFNAISTTFSDNNAVVNNLQATVPSGSVYGGGLYLTGNATITDCTLSGNYAQGIDVASFGPNALGSAWGGAVFSTGSLQVALSVITNNRATGGSDSSTSLGGQAYGGGIASLGVLSLSGSTISLNLTQGGEGAGAERSVQASAVGGGIYATKVLNVVNSTISGNAAQGASPKYYAETGGTAEGGGIDALGVTSIISSSVVDNDVEGGRGADFDGFFAGQGGIARGAGVFNSDTLTILNSTVADNQATGGAGGSDGSYDSVISQDATTGAGGSAAGGGIFEAGNLILNDSTVSGNSSVGGVEGTAYSEASHKGVAGTASSGGVDISSDEALFNNTIISGNTVNVSTSNDIAGSASFASANNLVGIGGGLTNGVHGNKIGIINPQLSPLGYYGGPTETLLPLPGSPVIDAGSNGLIPSGITTDQRGFPRISGKSVDIGSVEFGNVTITGTVFNDEWATGALQKGDPGVSGFTVYLDLNHDKKLDAGDYSVVTNSTGKYTFDGLFAGSYAVDVMGQTSYRPTTPIFATITAKAGATITVPSFGQTQDALVTGAVFVDTNGNGVQDKTESGIAGVRVFLDLQHNGKFVAGDPSIVTTSTGSFSFIIASPGTYLVRSIVPKGYKQTVPTSGFYTVTVGKASIRSGLLFGEGE